MATRILVTGSAGFIRFHLSRPLMDDGCQVFGIDNLNDYYDTNLKKARLAQLPQTSRFIFDPLDLVDGENLRRLVADFEPEVIVNLAAQAGVRYSMQNPLAYVNSNLRVFWNFMRPCGPTANLPHLVSSSLLSLFAATPL